MELATVGDMLTYARNNNFLKLLKDEPNLGEHHRGVIFVTQGSFLNADNILQELPYCDRHKLAAEEEFVLPGAFHNLLEVLSDAARFRGEGGDALARTTACVKECLRIVAGM